MAVLFCCDMQGAPPYDKALGIMSLYAKVLCSADALSTLLSRNLCLIIANYGLV